MEHQIADLTHVLVLDFCNPELHAQITSRIEYLKSVIDKVINEPTHIRKPPVSKAKAVRARGTNRVH